jgi:hypothetical protein
MIDQSAAAGTPDQMSLGGPQSASTFLGSIAGTTPRTAAEAESGFGFNAVVVAPAELARHVAAWEELAAHAAEPNVFYEPWMLLPALEEYGAGKNLLFVLVWVQDKSASMPPKLGALFPLEQRARFRGLPFPHLALWQHLHCFLCTPLLHREHGRACLAAFLGWLAGRSRGGRVIEWGDIAADGPFFELLTAALDEAGGPRHCAHHQKRALLRPRAGGEAYLQESLPGKSRKEFRRLERRMADMGPVEYVEFGPGDDLESWIRAFLAMEGGGWRGASGTSLDSTESGRRFLLSVASGVARQGRLMMLGLRAGGRFVALKINLLSGEGSFAFKIAFDEGYSRFSPGTLLELENIRRFHDRPGLRWMDSCADADHFMANRLWLDRRALVTMVTAADGLLERLFVSSLPLLQQLSRALRRLAAPPGAEAAPEGV